VADQIGAALESHKAENLHGLQEIKSDHANTIQSGPMEAWNLFRLARGEGAGGPRNRMSWLPGDLVEEPEYKAQEDRLRAAIAAAKAAMEPINATIHKIDGLIAEANSL
jgi:hypothetical protein